ncbi:MAG TPA: thermonuclease family protein [Desulfatiglandales bacterium]|nr:thermonuclease family protein [Desulfatiglandales bacterium]
MTNVIPINPLKLKHIIISLFITFVLALPTYSPAGQFKVTMVYDGDTIKAEGHDIVIYVLLAGLDAPEICLRENKKAQPYGREAKEYLENLILNKIVEVKGHGLGPYPYSNLVGEIFLEDRNINIDMIKKGFAEVYSEKLPEGLDITLYGEAEKEAKEAKRGVWSLKENYISPKAWRETHRDK